MRRRPPATLTTRVGAAETAVVTLTARVMAAEDLTGGSSLATTVNNHATAKSFRSLVTVVM